jgi:LCP family protein required for cell wall assembly
VAVLAATLLVLPDAAVRPATWSLTRVESARAVDFDEGVVWVLALGSDARPGEDVTGARADAIQLVALDLAAGRAVGIGIPRDAWLELPGRGENRINAALALGGPDLVARAVDSLTGVTPDYVFVAGFDGFRSMVGALGRPLEVRSPVAFVDPEFDLRVRRGANRLGPDEALDLARSRKQLPGGDFDRSANQQRLMLGILARLRAGEDRLGFMERGTLAALAGLRTDLAPAELYRLAQAVTQVRPGRVATCVVRGTFGQVSGQSIVYADRAQARRLAADAGDDARLRHGCRG